MADWEDAPDKGWEEAPTSKPMPANAGMVNFAATVLGTPANLATTPFEAVRTGLMAAGRYDLANKLPSVKNVALGSEWIKKKLRETGIEGLSPDNPQPESTMGTAAYDLASRGGFIPGGVLPAAGSMVAEKVAGPEWGGVGAILPSAGIQAYNTARAPSLAKAKELNTVRDKTLSDARELGYKVPPSQAGGGFMENRFESIGGKAAMNQQAVQDNQIVTNAVARRTIGLPENAPITIEALKAKRAEFAKPYEDIAAISPIASQALQRLRDIRNEATAEWKYYFMSAKPQAQRDAVALDNKAKVIERYLETVAKSIGKPELVNQMREARANIAKTYDVEKALNIGDGNIDARIWGRLLDQGKPMTGEMKAAARFAEAFPQAAKTASGSPAAGVSALEPYGAGALGILGASQFGLPGVAAAAIPYVRPAVRSALLSDFYQNRFVNPSYAPAVQPGSLQALLQAVVNQQQK